MESLITLYECPPLRARLSAHQCALNRARAAAPPAPRRWHRSIADAVAAAPPRECENCRGVLWFAEQIASFRHLIAQGFSILRDKGAYLRRVALWQGVDWCLRIVAILFFLKAFGLPATVHNALLVQVSGAKRIFEMGSAIGYSTIWLARAAGPKGKVFYTDGDPEKVHRAQMYFRMAGVAKRIEVQIGDALAIVKKTPGMFDVIFIDVDKNQYPAALHAVRPKLRRGGLLITDNTIWSGKAARPAPEEDKDTKGVQEFNRMVYASKELYPVLIPLRDGLTICRKS